MAGPVEPVPVCLLPVSWAGLSNPLMSKAANIETLNAGRCGVSI
jgi:hypothetical protein